MNHSIHPTYLCNNISNTNDQNVARNMNVKDPFIKVSDGNEEDGRCIRNWREDFVVKW